MGTSGWGNKPTSDSRQPGCHDFGVRAEAGRMSQSLKTLQAFIMLMTGTRSGPLKCKAARTRSIEFIISLIPVPLFKETDNNCA